MFDIGFGYELHTLHNLDDPLAEAYAKISRMTPWTTIYNIAQIYFPFVGDLPVPRAFEVAAARKAIAGRATILLRNKEIQTTTGKDILSLMVEENRKANGGLTDTEIVDQVMAFLLAGHETTSSAVIPLTEFY
jgi:cytochrome P450